MTHPTLSSRLAGRFVALSQRAIRVLQIWKCAAKFLPAGCLGVMTAVSSASAQDLTVAQIGPFTGLPSPDATEINAGAQAFFDSVNAAGGIGGRNIKLLKFDDGFTAPGFIEIWWRELNQTQRGLIENYGAEQASWHFPVTETVATTQMDLLHAA